MRKEGENPFNTCPPKKSTTFEKGGLKKKEVISVKKGEGFTLSAGEG